MMVNTHAVAITTLLTDPLVKTRHPLSILESVAIPCIGMRVSSLPKIPIKEVGLNSPVLE